MCSLAVGVGDAGNVGLRGGGAHKSPSWCPLHVRTDHRWHSSDSVDNLCCQVALLAVSPDLTPQPPLPRGEGEPERARRHFPRGNAITSSITGVSTEEEHVPVHTGPCFRYCLLRPGSYGTRDAGRGLRVARGEGMALEGKRGTEGGEGLLPRPLPASERGVRACSPMSMYFGLSKLREIAVLTLPVYWLLTGILSEARV